MKHEIQDKHHTISYIALQVTKNVAPWQVFSSPLILAEKKFIQNLKRSSTSMHASKYTRSEQYVLPAIIIGKTHSKDTT